jgi:hypothetical protein
LDTIAPGEGEDFMAYYYFHVFVDDEKIKEEFITNQFSMEMINK